MMVIDAKRLPGREVLITRRSGEAEIVGDFHPYVYAVPGHELPLGRVVDEASKRVFWTGKKVKTEKIELDHPSQVSEVKSKTKTPLFEFDIDYLLRFCLDCAHSDPPETLEGITYDIETSENNFRTGAYARGQIEYEDGFEMSFDDPESIDDPSELAEILNDSGFVIAHNALWFDNAIMDGYGLETHVQRMANPLTGGRLEEARLIKNSLNLDTIQLADRFLARPPSLSLKLLAPYLGVGEPKIISPSMIDRVDSRKMREYNRRDVELTCGLADRLVPQLWTVWDALKIPPTVYLRFYGSGTYETSAVLFYRRSGDRYYLPAKERNVRFEGEYANPHARKYEPYKIVGPRIITPRETDSENTTVENVWEADYSSLFPNIMVNESISPETTSQFGLGDGVLLERKESGEQKEVGTIIEDGGFFPAILSELIDLVEKYKKRAKKDPSYEPIYVSAKGTLRNAFTHGAMMSSRRPSGCRFINILAGAKIFTRARELTDAAIETAERAGAEIHTADTDGMYFSEVNGNEIARLVKKETGYDIDATRYPIGHFCAGKVYALLREDGTLKVKGASLHGRNIPPVSTEAFQAALKDCMKAKDVNRKKIEHGIDEFLAKDHALGKYAFRISLRPPSEYKSEHRKKSVKYFAEEWKMPTGVSFDAVVIRGSEGVKLTEKPWATADERQWRKIVPLESYSDQELDRRWYRIKTMGILDRFLPVQNRRGEQASLADYA